ncbi:MAG: DUF1624 domain-containing protein, partial [Devosiaceae bacterium]|nr:DUF1624 domain-containing protein [Devosiaceae bacterium MH13]
MALAQAPKTEDTSAAGMPRLVWLDRARGAALVAMIVFHAAWNAVQFGAVAWTAGRDAALAAIAPWIAGSFLVISGAALALAAHAAASRGQELIKSRPFLRRLALLVLAASAVNVGSWLALPQAPIYFGVLHHIAVA